MSVGTALQELRLCISCTVVNILSLHWCTDVHAGRPWFCSQFLLAEHCRTRAMPVLMVTCRNCKWAAPVPAWGCADTMPSLPHSHQAELSFSEQSGPTACKEWAGMSSSSLVLHLLAEPRSRSSYTFLHECKIATANSKIPFFSQIALEYSTWQNVLRYI